MNRRRSDEKDTAGSGYVRELNTQLRDGCADLDEFCREFEIGRAGLEEKLLEAGYVYDRAVNRFK